MAATPRPLCRPSRGGKRGLYRAKLASAAPIRQPDVGAPWDCPRSPQQHYGPIGAATLKTSVPMACSSDSKRPHFPLMFATKYPERFIRKCMQKCPQPCAHPRRLVCPDLDSDLHLYLNLHLNPLSFPALNRALLQK